MIKQNEIFIFSGDHNKENKKMKFQILKENNNTKYSTMHKMNINSVENRFKLLEVEDQNMVYINS